MSISLTSSNSTNSQLKLPTEIQGKIVYYFAANYKPSNFKIIRLCSLLSKAVNKEIELLYEQRSKEKGMYVRWTVCQEIKISRNFHQWFFSSQFFKLLRLKPDSFSFSEDYQHKIKIFAQGVSNNLKVFLGRSPFLTNFFMLLEENDQARSFEIVSKIIQVAPLGTEEVILQTFINAFIKPLDIESLSTIVENDVTLLPFITKVALTLGFSEIDVLFKRAISLWSPAKDSMILESIINTLLHAVRNQNCKFERGPTPHWNPRGSLWIYELLNNLCEKEENRIPPILFALAYANRYFAYRDLYNSFDSVEAIKRANALIEKVDLEKLSHRLLDPIIKEGISYCLDEPSPVDFLLPYLESDSMSYNMRLFQIACKIRSGQFDEAENLFNHYLRCRKKNLNELNDYELAIYYFFQLRVPSSLIRLRETLKDYESFLEKRMQKKQIYAGFPVPSYSWKVMTRTLLSLGEFREADQRLVSSPVVATKNRHEYSLVVQKMFDLSYTGPVITGLGYLAPPTTLGSFYSDHSDNLSFIVANLSRFSFSEECLTLLQKDYLKLLIQLFNDSIAAWKNARKNDLEDALIVLGNSSTRWALACLTTIYEDPNNREVSVILSLVNAIVRRKYEYKYPLNQKEKIIVDQLPWLIETLLKQNQLPRRFLLHIMDHLLECEKASEVSESLISQVLPLILRIGDPPAEIKQLKSNG